MSSDSEVLTSRTSDPGAEVTARSRVEPRPAHHRIAHAVGNALLFAGFAVAALLITLAVLARTDASGVSRIAGHPVLTVLSDSMTPTFRAGDLLVDRPADGPATGLAVGDAITFKNGSDRQLITHRIVAVDRGPTGISFRTQGDANNAPDVRPVAPEQVVGIYSTRIPYAGYALLIVVPVAALLLPMFRKWWQAAAEPESRPVAPTVDATLLTGARPGGRADAADT
jgi:signal peptidase